MTPGVHLVRTEENTPALEAATEHFGTRVGLDGVLPRLNRQAVRDRVPGRRVEWGFRWTEHDVASPRWWPQGITTSADAGVHDDDRVGGRGLLVTSWYSTGAAGSRISLVDVESLEYRHVLLVVPALDGRGRPVLRPLRVHAGGLVWTGPYLHVAGTRRGLFSCSLDDLVRLRSPQDADGYRFVLPVRFGYDAKARGTELMRYSFLSLDHDAEPPQLLAGEYATGDMTRRLVRYPLDPHTHHLAAHEDGTARPVWLDERGLGHMQGAVVARGRYYVTSSRGPRGRGHLHVGRPGHFRTLHWALPPGPEDITYWASTDRLWSQSEHPGKRWVFAVDRGSLPG